MASFSTTFGLSTVYLLLVLYFFGGKPQYVNATIPTINANLYRVGTGSPFQVYGGPQDIEQFLYTGNFQVNNGGVVSIPILFTKVANTVFASSSYAIGDSINIPTITAVGGSNFVSSSTIPSRFWPQYIYRFFLVVWIDTSLTTQFARGEVRPDGYINIYADMLGNPFPKSIAYPSHRIGGGISFSYVVPNPITFNSSMFLGPSIATGVTDLINPITSIEQWSGIFPYRICTSETLTNSSIGSLTINFLKFGQTVVVSFPGADVAVPFGLYIYSDPASPLPIRFRPCNTHSFWAVVSTNSGSAHGAQGQISTNGDVRIWGSSIRGYFAWNNNGLYPSSTTFTTCELPYPSTSSSFTADLISYPGTWTGNPVPNLTPVPAYISQSTFNTLINGATYLGGGQYFTLLFTVIGQQVTMTSLTDNIQGIPTTTTAPLPVALRPCGYHRFFYTVGIPGNPASEARAEINLAGYLQFYRDSGGNTFNTPNSAIYVFSTTFFTC